jgi:hypothetical protein
VSADEPDLRALLEEIHTKIEGLITNVAAIQARLDEGAPAEAAGAPASPASPAAPTKEAELLLAGDSGDNEEVQAACQRRDEACGVVAAFVEAAMIKSDAKCWAALAELTHSSEMEGPRSMDHLKAFSWKKLRVNAKRYFKGKKVPTAAWTEPAVVEGSTERVKVFVAHGKDATSPVTVARDAEADGAWRVQSCSL